MAFTAGFFEGEGCLLPRTAARKGYGVQLVQSEGNNGFAALSRIQAAWNMGNIYQQPARGRSGPRSVWLVQREYQVAFFLRAIVDNLFIKKQAALDAIEDLERRGL